MTIYFDHSSTSHPKPQEVWMAISDYLENIGASPGRGCHSLSQKAQQLVTSCKELLAQFFGVKGLEEHFHFTSNATHGLNLILKGFLKPGDHVITSLLELNSLLRPLEKLRVQSRIEVDYLPLDSEGLPMLEELPKLARKNTRLIAITHGSNVIGVETQIKEIHAFCQKQGIKLLLDAAQTAGVLPLDLSEIPVDFLAFTGHKSLLGPSGIGGVFIREPYILDTLMEGGTGVNSHSLLHPESSQFKFEAGTCNYIGIAGLKASLEYLMQNDYLQWAEQTHALTSYCYQGLKALDFVTLYGPSPEKRRLPIISFNVDGLFPGEVSHLLDQSYGIMTRPGLHCAPLVHKALKTFPHGAVRISFSHTNSREEVDLLLHALHETQAYSLHS